VAIGGVTRKGGRSKSRGCDLDHFAGVVTAAMRVRGRIYLREAPNRSEQHSDTLSRVAEGILDRPRQRASVLEEKFRGLIGKDRASLELADWFRGVQLTALRQTATVQCLGMRNPLPFATVSRLSTERELPGDGFAPVLKEPLRSCSLATPELVPIQMIPDAETA